MLFNTLGDDECPPVLPVVVNNRDLWIHELHNRRISAIGWWAGYHRDLSWSEFPESCELKDHVLALPVHQDLGELEMKHIILSIRKIASDFEKCPPNDNRIVDIKPTVSKHSQPLGMNV